MKMPFTKAHEPTAEEILQDNVYVFVKNAKSFEDMEKAQKLVQNQQTIKNGRKVVILGIEARDWLLFAGPVAQILAILNKEETKVITSKALSFVTKGRLR